MALDASDEQQLLRATAQDRYISTFNVREFMVLAGRYPQYAGIIVAAQSRWSLSEPIAALERVLSETGQRSGRVRCAA